MIARSATLLARADEVIEWIVAMKRREFITKAERFAN
jgi:hypothetical protein